MRKIYFVLISISLLMLTGCGSIESTNLDNIKVDNISLGQSFDTLDLSKYEARDHISNEYNYEFKELQLKTNDSNNVDKIWSYMLDYNFLSINEKGNFKNIEQITNILGSNYKESWHNMEQGLKSHVYIDNKLNITVKFVYSDISEAKELVWTILETI